MNSESNFSKRNVLVVDDQAQNLKLLSAILRSSYNLYLANSGEKALEILKKQKPELILLDVMMSEMNGFEVAARIKKQEELAEIPILFLTALTDSEAIKKAYQSGGMDYVTKPIITSELLARMEVHLKIYDNKRELKQLNEILELKNKQKDKLLSIISHDMTNAVSGSRQLIEILVNKLRQGKLTLESLSKPLEATYRGINGASELLQELLWWSKSQFKQVKYNAKPIDYLSIVKKVIALEETRLDAKNLELRTDFSEIPETILADSDMLSVVIRNLLGNAIKFSNENAEISISVKGENSAIITCIGDEGVGISSENLDKLFELDSDHTTPGTNGEKGTGLGLTLCKGLIETWGGEIWVESELDEGSKFYFTIPL